MDERFFDPFPRFLVSRVEEEVLGERLPAAGQGLTEAAEPALPVVLLLFGGLLVLAEELGPAAAHAERACNGSEESRLETISVTPWAPIVTP